MTFPPIASLRELETYMATIFCIWLKGAIFSNFLNKHVSTMSSKMLIYLLCNTVMQLQSIAMLHNSIASGHSIDHLAYTCFNCNGQYIYIYRSVRSIRLRHLTIHNSLCSALDVLELLCSFYLL